MLFDLRGRGRRRTVQAIYLGLAILIGAGLVGFGIGGGFGGGGLFNAVGTNGTSGGSFGDKVKQDQKLTQRQPNNASAWASLVHDLYADAGNGANYDQTNGQFTAKGRAVLAQAQQAWNQYLRINTAHPDPDLANLMINAFLGPGSLNDPKAAVQALEIAITNRPNNANLEFSLAQAAYQAGDARQGDLAAAKTVSLVPAAQRAALRKALAQFKKNPTGTATTAPTPRPPRPPPPRPTTTAPHHHRATATRPPRRPTKTQGATSRTPRCGVEAAAPRFTCAAVG